MPHSSSTSPSHAAEPTASPVELPDTPTETVASQFPEAASPAKRRNRWSAIVWLFRLLLLGAGGSVAVVAGMAIAHFYPDSSQEMPFAERLLHSSDTVLRQLERLPQITLKQD